MKNGFPSTLSKVQFLWLFSLICLFWIFSGLVGHEPWKPDEAYSFGMVWHYIQGGHWLVPTIADVPFMEKPPFFYLLAGWVAQALYPWLDYPDGARLTNSVFFIVIFLMLALTAAQVQAGNKQHKSNSLMPYLAVLLFISCFGMVYRVHLMITDVALLCGFAISFYGLSLLQSHNLRSAFFLGTGVGMGFMCKGILAPGIIGTICLSLFLHSRFRNWQVVRVFLLALLWSAPWLLVWPIALYQESEPLFWLWFWDNNLARFLGATDLGPTAATAFYFKLLPWYAMPVLPLSLLYGWQQLHGVNYKKTIFLLATLSSVILLNTAWQQLYAVPIVAVLLWIVSRGSADNRLIIPLHFFSITLLVLSLSSKARELYALPLLLPLAVMAADYLSTYQSRIYCWLNYLAIIISGILISFLWLLWLAILWPDLPFLGDYLQQNQPGFISNTSSWFFWGGLTAALSCTVLWCVVVALPYYPDKLVLSWSAGITAVWCLLSTLLLPYLDYGMAYKDMLAQLKGKLPAQYNCMMSYKLAEEYQALMHYYVDEKMFELTMPEYKQECDLLFMRTKYEARLSPGWEKIYQGHRPGDHKTFSLYLKRTAQATISL